MIDKLKIQEAIEQVLKKYSVFLIDLVFRNERGSKVLEIFIDNYKGISTDLCADVSRELSIVLDQENLINGNYYLNVSSPGLSRPLKYPMQYHKHIGYPIQVSYLLNNQIIQITGELSSVNDENITVKDKKGNQHIIKFSDINKALIKTPW